MNTALCEKTQNRRLCALSYRRLSIFFAVFLASFWFITHPETVKSTVTEALSFCVATLIPSLFPFAIAGEILVLSGFGALCGKLFGNRFMRGRGVSAFLLGALCGFPIGGKTAIAFFENGELEKNEAELLCAVSNNAGAGFVIAGIGSAMWKNTAFGVTLYIVQLISALASAYALRPLFKRGEGARSIRSDKKEKYTAFSFSYVISLAVPNAVNSMLKICGFVVFFELILSSVTFYGVSPVTRAVISVFLEITAGVTSLTSLTIAPANEIFAKLGTFFAVGFGGLSVHAQLASFAEKSGISMRKYGLFKLVQASLCVLFGAAASVILPV